MNDDEYRLADGETRHATISQKTKYFYNFDHQGSVREGTDSNKNVVAAWKEQARTASTGSAPSPVTSTTCRSPAVTGLQAEAILSKLPADG